MDFEWFELGVGLHSMWHGKFLLAKLNFYDMENTFVVAFGYMDDMFWSGIGKCGVK